MRKAIPPGYSLAEFSKLKDPERFAVEHGFVCAGHLRVYLTVCEPEHPEITNPSFLQLACISYMLEDHPSRIEKAREQYDANPSLTQTDIHHAAAIGDVSQVERFLDADPDCINRHGGWFDWEPLMYACYSRLEIPGMSTLAVAKLLLERGADPNAHSMLAGQYRFTALTGAFGEGEGGPGILPRHPNCLESARALLEAGADPNDGQGLYNRMFCDDDSHLELLLEFGLNTNHRCNWLLNEDGELKDNPASILQHQLSWALKTHFPERARLLVEHGTELVRPDDEPPFYELAMRAGKPELAEFLIEHGAPKTELDSLAHLACACMAADEDKARELLDKEPNLLQRLQETNRAFLIDAAGRNQLDAVRLIADLGANLDQQLYCSPMHEAAAKGCVEMLRLLVEKGANFRLRDCSYSATPLQWANHLNQPEAAEFLGNLNVDIFDAIIANRIDYIAQLLDDDPSLLKLTLGQINEDDADKDFAWRTPLASAISRKKHDIVKLLLDRGANTRIKDNEGRNLLDLAKRESTTEIIALLRKHL